MKVDNVVLVQINPREKRQADRLTLEVEKYRLSDDPDVIYCFF